MIRTEVNAGNFLKSILHVRDFTRQFNPFIHNAQFKCGQYINAGDSRPILENWNVCPCMLCKNLFNIDFTVKKDNLS